MLHHHWRCSFHKWACSCHAENARKWPHEWLNCECASSAWSCSLHRAQNRSCVTKPTKTISQWSWFILRFHSLCWIKESRDGWCGRGMVYCRMADCNDDTFSLWTPPSAWTTPELQGGVREKRLQTWIAFERKVYRIHSQIHNLYSKGWCGYIIVLIYHWYHYVSTLEGVYINLGNLSQGSPKGRYRFLPACSLSLEVYMVKYYFLKPLEGN